MNIKNKIKWLEHNLINDRIINDTNGFTAILINKGPIWFMTFESVDLSFYGQNAYLLRHNIIKRSPGVTWEYPQKIIE